MSIFEHFFKLLSLIWKLGAGPDPDQSEMQEPDPDQSDKQDPDPHRSEMQDPDQ
jgi:hypothetical protein